MFIPDDNPQSDDINKDLESNDGDKSQISDVDLGDGNKVSLDVLREAYNFHNKFRYITFYFFRNFWSIS